MPRMTREIQVRLERSLANDETRLYVTLRETVDGTRKRLRPGPDESWVPINPGDHVTPLLTFQYEEGDTALQTLAQDLYDLGYRPRGLEDARSFGQLAQARLTAQDVQVQRAMTQVDALIDTVRAMKPIVVQQTIDPRLGVRVPRSTEEKIRREADPETETLRMELQHLLKQYNELQDAHNDLKRKVESQK